MKREIVVGVTGRRHIVPDAIPAIENASRLLTRTLNDAAEETGATIWVCTGLAVGADTVAARAVLEEKERGVDELFEEFTNWVTDTLTIQDNPYIRVITVFSGAEQ